MRKKREKKQGKTNLKKRRKKIIPTELEPRPLADHRRPELDKLEEHLPQRQGPRGAVDERDHVAGEAGLLFLFVVVVIVEVFEFFV